MRRALLLALAVLCGAGAVAILAAPGAPAQSGGLPAPAAGAPAGAGADPALVARGRALFVDGCASCHGMDAHGVRGQGPSLYGAGAAAADFYLSTGRMPLNVPSQAPVRADPQYSRTQIDALVAYVGSLGGAPVPAVTPARGNLARGMRAFTDHCAGCHQVLARGGIVTGAIAPDLGQATPRQIAEAVRVGPYLMPEFTERQIDRATLDDIARYVVAVRHPDDRGGWGIGHIGPVPEGMIAWFLAALSLVIVARLIGEREI